MLACCKVSGYFGAEPMGRIMICRSVGRKRAGPGHATLGLNSECWPEGSLVFGRSRSISSDCEPVASTLSGRLDDLSEGLYLVRTGGGGGGECVQERMGPRVR